MIEEYVPSMKGTNGESMARLIWVDEQTIVCPKRSADVQHAFGWVMQLVRRLPFSGPWKSGYTTVVFMFPTDRAKKAVRRSRQDQAWSRWRIASVRNMTCLEGRLRNGTAATDLTGTTFTNAMVYDQMFKRLVGLQGPNVASWSL